MFWVHVPAQGPCQRVLRHHQPPAACLPAPSGVTFLQLCFAGMRSNDDILAFNDTLKDSFKYDLQAWRESEAKRNRQVAVCLGVLFVCPPTCQWAQL